MKNKFTSIINYINLFAVLYLTATAIFRSIPLHLIGFYLFFITYIIEFFLEKKWRFVVFDKRHFYFIVMLFFFFLPLIYFPLDSNSYFKKLLEFRYPLLGFAVVGFFGVNKKYKLNYFLNTFIITSVLVILYLIFKIGFWEFLRNPQRNELFTYTRIAYVNSHMMFNFFLNLALISTWYIVTRTWKRTVKWKRYLYIAALTLIFYILYISEGRSGFLASILLMLGFVFFEVWKRRKSIGLVIAFLVPFLVILVGSNHDRMSKNELEVEPRLFLWEAAVSVIKEKPVLGFGISNAQDKFDVARAEYQTDTYRIMWQDANLLDSHNQYLQTTMEFGILGLLVLLFLYIFPIIIAEKKRRLFAFFVMWLCIYQSIFDMFITGQFCTIFCILTLLILSVENNVVKEPVKTDKPLRM